MYKTLFANPVTFILQQQIIITTAELNGLSYEAYKIWILHFQQRTLAKYNSM